MPSLVAIDRLAKDTGCKKHNDCLTCPLPKCIYDTKVIGKVERRYITIRQMAKSMSKEKIANQLGINIRTVQRALKEQ